MFDDQTELLTLDGFVNVQDLRAGYMLAHVGTKDGRLSYSGLQEINNFQYTGPSYQIVHGGVDIVITPEHKVLVKLRQSGNKWSEQWSLIPTTSLLHRSMVRYLRHVSSFDGETLSVQTPMPLTENFCRLVGFFLGDGYSVHGSGQLKFHLKLARKIEFLKSLGYPVESQRGDRYVIKHKHIGDWFRSQFYSTSGDKILPSWCTRLSSTLAASILEGLRNSDGSQHRGSWTYSSTSESLLHSMQHLSIHAGMCMHFTISTDNRSEAHNPLHRATVLSRMTEPVINQSSRNTFDLTISEPKAMYSIPLSDGIAVVARRGLKPVIIGGS